MKKLVLSLSLVLAFSSATAAFAAIPQNIRIGTDPTYAPFESKNSQGELVGFDIDLAKELCKRINTQCTFVENPLYVCRKPTGCVNPVLKSEED